MADKPNDANRSDGFLSRWSRRKQDVRAGMPVAEVPQTTAVPAKAPLAAPFVENYQQNSLPAQQNIAQAATNNVSNEGATSATDTLPPAPTLVDAKALTPESDFKPFMANNVSSEVKNAAMKKLFTDPHYNVMDMMDTYVDDYSKSDPIPESMLKEMVSVKFLKLFERDEEEPEKVKTQVRSLSAMPPVAEAEAPSTETPNLTRDDADTPRAQSVAQLPSSATPENTLPHDDPDLRLQPNDAPERQGLGRSAG